MTKAPASVPRRMLGSTGLEVSALGMGSSPFRNGHAKDWSRFVEEGFDMGVTYFDTARSYVNGEEAIGELPNGIREKITLTTKTGARGGAHCLKDLEKSLRTTRRNHLDIWMTHMLSTEEEYEYCTALAGFCDIAAAAKQAGLVRATGASFHASTDLILRAIEEQAFDVVMFPFNIIGRETVFGSSIASYRDRLLPAAASRNVGVVVMKVLAGGEMRHGAPGLRFLTDVENGRDEIAGAVRYAVCRPGIDVAVVGSGSHDELRANVRAACGAEEDLSLCEKWEQLVAELSAGPCTRCGQCLNVCPEGIEIPKVFRLYDQFTRFGMRGVARFKYKLMEPNANDCSHCRKCQEACPEDFDIAVRLSDAHNILKPADHTPAVRPQEFEQDQSISA